MRHSFPKRGKLYHGTSCRMLKHIRRHGLEPGSYLTDSPKEAKFYGKRKSAQIQKAKFDALEARGNPRHRVPPESDTCVFEVKCGGDLEWYEAVADEDFGHYNYFVSSERIPWRCLGLRERFKGRR